MSRFLLLLVIVCALVSCQHVALASYIHFCTPQELVTKADVLIVAQVETVETVGKEPTQYPPLLRRKAMMRVLRWSTSSPLKQMINDGSLEMEFETKDWSRMGAYTGGFDYPDFRLGTVALLPLKAPPEGGTAWRLVSHAEGCTIPATNTPLPGVQPTNGHEFIAAEIAATLVNGTPSQRSAAASYVAKASRGRPDGSNAAPLAEIDRLLTTHVQNEAHWLDIFLSLYAPWGVWETPHPTFAQLRAASRQSKMRWFLPARVLSHLDSPQRDECIIVALISQGEAGAFSSALTLSLNYPQDIRVAKLLQASLKQSAPGALSMVEHLFTDYRPAAETSSRAKVQPYQRLLPTALSAARQELVRPQATPQSLKAARTILTKFGTAQDKESMRRQREPQPTASAGRTG